jgi:hypothetical protein
MQELLEQLLEQDFDDLFEPVSDEEADSRLSPIRREMAVLVRGMTNEQLRFMLVCVYKLYNNSLYRMAQDELRRHNYDYEAVRQELIRWTREASDEHASDVLYRYKRGYE